MRPEPPPTIEDLTALPIIIDNRTRMATASEAESLAYPSRQMTAAELVEFWRSMGLGAMTRSGAAAHRAVHAEIFGPALPRSDDTTGEWTS